MVAWAALADEQEHCQKQVGAAATGRSLLRQVQLALVYLHEKTRASGALDFSSQCQICAAVNLGTLQKLRYLRGPRDRPSVPFSRLIMGAKPGGCF